jgi:5'-nucleotidase
LQGLPAIALSQFMGPRTEVLDDPFEAAIHHGAGLVKRLLEHGHWEDRAYRTFYNVNFPPCGAAEVMGTRVAAQGFRDYTTFSVEPVQSPSGRRFLWIKGGAQHLPTGPGTDVTANVEGYISVTPMRADLTAHDQLASLRERLE